MAHQVGVRGLQAVVPREGRGEAVHAALAADTADLERLRRHGGHASERSARSRTMSGRPISSCRSASGRRAEKRTFGRCDGGSRPAFRIELAVVRLCR